MRIKRLHVTNFKGARQIDIHSADPTCNELAGENEAGKSSVLDAIVAALAGTRQIDPKPLTEGTLKGSVELDLGDIVVKRSFTEKNAAGGGSLTIKAADGSKWGQRELTGILGDFTFDPLAFSRASVRDQVDALQRLAGDEFVAQLKALDDKLEVLAENRRDLGRDLKKFGVIPDLPKVEQVDTGKVMADLELWEEHEEAVRIKEGKVANAEVGYKATFEAGGEAVQRVDRLKAELRQAQEDLDTLAAQQAKEQSSLAKLSAVTIPEPDGLPPKAELKALVMQAGETNAAADAYAKAEDQRTLKRKLEAEHTTAERLIEKTRDSRELLARSAQLPMDGLTWGPNGIALEGIPFGQLASSRKLRLSSRIGMAVDAALKIMFIRDGSLLGDQAFAEMVEIAKEHGYQLWMETVGGGHSDALVITEGELDTDDDAEPADDLDGEL